MAPVDYDDIGDLDDSGLTLSSKDDTTTPGTNQNEYANPDAPTEPTSKFEEALDKQDPKIYPEIQTLSDDDKADIEDYDADRNRDRNEADDDYETSGRKPASFEPDTELERHTGTYLGRKDDQCDESDDADRGQLVKTVEYVKPFTIIGEITKEGKIIYEGDAEYHATATRLRDRDYEEYRYYTYDEKQTYDVSQKGKIITQQQIKPDKMYLEDRVEWQLSEPVPLKPEEIKPIFPDVPTKFNWTFVGREKVPINTTSPEYDRLGELESTTTTPVCDRTQIVSGSVKLDFSNKKVFTPQNKVGLFYDKHVNNELKTLCKDDLEDTTANPWAKDFLDQLSKNGVTLDELLKPDCDLSAPTKVVDISNNCKVNVISEESFELKWQEEETSSYKQWKIYKGTKTYKEHGKDDSITDKYTVADNVKRTGYFYQKGKETGKINTYLKQFGEEAQRTKYGDAVKTNESQEEHDASKDVDGTWHKPTDWVFEKGGWKVKEGDKPVQKGEITDEVTRYVEHSIIEGDACYKVTLNKCPIMKIKVDMTCPNKESHQNAFKGNTEIGKDHCFDASCDLFDNDNACSTPDCAAKNFDSGTETNVPTSTEEGDNNTKCNSLLKSSDYKALVADNATAAERVAYVLIQSYNDNYNYKGDQSDYREVFARGTVDAKAIVAATANNRAGLQLTEAEAQQALDLYDGKVSQTGVAGAATYAAGNGDGDLDNDEFVNCGKATTSSLLDEAVNEVEDDAFGSEGELSADDAVEAVAEEHVTVEAVVAEVVAA